MKATACALIANNISQIIYWIPCVNLVYPARNYGFLSESTTVLGEYFLKLQGALMTARRREEIG